MLLAAGIDTGTRKAYGQVAGEVCGSGDGKAKPPTREPRGAMARKDGLGTHASSTHKITDSSGT